MSRCRHAKVPAPRLPHPRARRMVGAVGRRSGRRATVGLPSGPSAEPVSVERSAGDDGAVVDDARAAAGRPRGASAARRGPRDRLLLRVPDGRHVESSDGAAGIDERGAGDPEVPGGAVLAGVPGVRARVPAGDAGRHPGAGARRGVRWGHADAHVRSRIPRCAGGLGVLFADREPWARCGADRSLAGQRPVASADARGDRARSGAAEPARVGDHPGGNLVVPRGQRVGGDLATIPTCASASETGCVLAWSAFANTPPRTALFGRAGGSLRAATGLPDVPNGEVACTNPAELSGDAGRLQPITRSERFPGLIGVSLGLMFYGLPPRASTPWVIPGERYRASCVTWAGARVLRVRAASALSVVPYEAAVPGLGPAPCRPEPAARQPHHDRARASARRGRPSTPSPPPETTSAPPPEPTGR